MQSIRAPLIFPLTLGWRAMRHSPTTLQLAQLQWWTFRVSLFISSVQAVAANGKRGEKVKVKWMRHKAKSEITFQIPLSLITLSFVYYREWNWDASCNRVSVVVFKELHLNVIKIQLISLLEHNFLGHKAHKPLLQLGCSKLGPKATVEHLEETYASHSVCFISRPPTKVNLPLACG